MAEVINDVDVLGCPRDGILLGLDDTGTAQAIGVRLPLTDRWVVYDRMNDSTTCYGEDNVRELLLQLARGDQPE